MNHVVVLVRTRKTVLLLLASVLTAMLMTCGVTLLGAAGTAKADVPSQEGKILFHSSPVNSPSELQIMNPDGSSRSSFTPALSNAVMPEWSPDGTKFAYVSQDGSAHHGGILISSADGTQRTPVPNTTGFPPEVRSITWSPDGTKLAFAVDKYVDVIDPFTGEPYTLTSSDIYTVNVDGSNLTNLRKDVPPEHAAYMDPDWSPDGTTIAFSHEDIFGDHVVREIYTVNADGTGQPTGFTDPVRGRQPDWSPDGSEIAFVGPDSDLYVMNADGTGQRKITADGGRPPFGSFEPKEAVEEAVPEWSPDGTKLAFAGLPISCTSFGCTIIGFDIFTVGIDGSEKKNLTNTSDLSEYSPSWQPVFASPDTTAPKVDAVSPINRAKDVARGTDVTANFSEKMDPDSVSGATFKLYRVNPDGSTRQITNAPVTLSEEGLTATLDPFGGSTTRLLPNTRYKAVVSIGAKDLAGNALDQNATKEGNQSMKWTFTTR
jgi:Tol biopolymer transport system component